MNGDAPWHGKEQANSSNDNGEKALHIIAMEGIGYVYWQDGDMWLGYLEEFPDYMTQGASAKLLGLTQPRLNALLKGRLSQFSLDALVNITRRAGLNVRLVVKKAA